jgi:hypothetical protein
VAAALDDDKEFVAIRMAMLVVARARRQNGPADEEFVRAGGFLVDEKLHLHVDPAVFFGEAADFGDIAKIGAIRFHLDIPPRRR